MAEKIRVCPEAAAERANSSAERCAGAWAKALLLCNRSFGRVIGELDVAMDTLAVCSAAGTRDAFAVMEHAADIIQRKQRILNLKIITRDMLHSLPGAERRLLARRYITGSSAERISRDDGIGLRTFYRRLDAALALCGGYLKRKDYDNAYFEGRYGGEGWIIRKMGI